MFGNFFMFDLMSVIVPLMFLVVFGIFIASFIKGLSQQKRNDNSPKLTTEATVVTKRSRVWGDHSHTNYYATFQFESGDRLELEIPHHRFGYLVEGDKGKLTFQGTRFLEFERQ